MVIAATLASSALAQTAAVTEKQARAWAGTAAKEADGDRTAFFKAFNALVREVRPDYPDQDPISTAVLIAHAPGGIVIAQSPLALFESVAADHVRTMDSLAAVPWNPGTAVTVATTQIDAPNILKIVVRKNGAVVEPVKSELRPVEKTSQMGLKRTLNEGSVYYAPSVFEAGADIAIIAVPESGTNIVKKLTEREISLLR